MASGYACTASGPWGVPLLSGIPVANAAGGLYVYDLSAQPTSATGHITIMHGSAPATVASVQVGSSLNAQPPFSSPSSCMVWPAPGPGSLGPPEQPAAGFIAQGPMSAVGSAGGQAATPFLLPVAVLGGHAIQMCIAEGQSHAGFVAAQSLIEQPGKPHEARSPCPSVNGRSSCPSTAAESVVAAGSRSVSILSTTVSDTDFDSTIPKEEHDSHNDCDHRETHIQCKRWGMPLELCENEDLCNEVLQFIGEDCGQERQSAITSWLLPFVKHLSLAKYSTHVIQKLLEVGDKASKENIIKELQAHVRDLYKSAPGNHVLAKIIAELPPSTVSVIVQELVQRVREVARHQYGCRILERLIEHHEDKGDMTRLLNALVHDAEPLSRHPFGTFVIQHLVEYGSMSRREDILSQVIHRLPALAMHRTASHFVQQLLSFGSPSMQERIVRSLLKAEPPRSLPDLVKSHYGCFVAEHFANVVSTFSEVRQALAKAQPSFTQAQLKSGRRVLKKFGLSPCHPGTTLV